MSTTIPLKEAIQQPNSGPKPIDIKRFQNRAREETVDVPKLERNIKLPSFEKILKGVKVRLAKKNRNNRKRGGKRQQRKRLNKKLDVKKKNLEKPIVNELEQK